MPPNQQWHCNISMAMMVICQYCSTHFILFMTFERFYSIVKPHKAASFNTVKRAKFTIACIVCFSSSVCIPNLFLTLTMGRTCFIFGKGMSLKFMKIYQWVRVAFAFILPFVLLLIMNSFIIHTLRNRSSLFKSEEETTGESTTRSPNTKHSEKQVYVTLLSVTFSFLILLAPVYTYELVIEITGYSSKTPERNFGKIYLLCFGLLKHTVLKIPMLKQQLLVSHKVNHRLLYFVALRTSYLFENNFMLWNMVSNW